MPSILDQITKEDHTSISEREEEERTNTYGTGTKMQAICIFRAFFLSLCLFHDTLYDIKKQITQLQFSIQ